MKIEWERHPDGAKNIDHAVAYTQPVADALREHAEKIAREARNILDTTSGSHDKAPRSKIDTVHEDSGTELDSWVTLEAAWDTESSQGDLAAALSIEVGHYTRARKSAGYGPLTEPEHTRHWVPGVAPLKRAAQKAARNAKLSIK